MIVRVKRRQNGFVVLTTMTLRMAMLSFKARGLWATCMTYPDDWEFRPEHLATLSDHDGVSAVRSGMKELASVGLACLEQLREEDGRLVGSRWVIYETPELNPHLRRGNGRPTEGRDAENHDLGDNRGARNLYLGAGTRVQRSGERRSEPDSGDSAGRHRDAENPNLGHRGAGDPRLGKAEARAHRNSEESRLEQPAPLHKNKQHEASTTVRNTENNRQTRARVRETRAIGELVQGENGMPVVLSEEEDGDVETLVALLVSCDVDLPVAQHLAASHPHAVRRNVLLFREKVEAGEVRSPGWLVRAVREDYAGGEAQLYTYQAALNLFHRLGGRFDDHFEPLPCGEETRFRRKRVTHG